MAIHRPRHCKEPSDAAIYGSSSLRGAKATWQSIVVDCFASLAMTGLCCNDVVAIYGSSSLRGAKATWQSIVVVCFASLAMTGLCCNDDAAICGSSSLRGAKATRQSVGARHCEESARTTKQSITVDCFAFGSQ